MYILNNTYFEKISSQQLSADGLSDLESVLTDLQMPKRATTGSCGYDFYLPYDLCLKPGETAKIPSLMRCHIDGGWFLMVAPRSSLGFKYKVKLDNTVGIIDSDYYGAKNEGHIWIKMTNTGDKDLSLKAGEAFCQGIFLPFGVVTNDAEETKEERTGGFGSTNKN